MKAANDTPMLPSKFDQKKVCPESESETEFGFGCALMLFHLKKLLDSANIISHGLYDCSLGGKKKSFIHSLDKQCLMTYIKCTLSKNVSKSAQIFMWRKFNILCYFVFFFEFFYLLWFAFFHFISIYIYWQYYLNFSL